MPKAEKLFCPGGWDDAKHPRGHVPAPRRRRPRACLRRRSLLGNNGSLRPVFPTLPRCFLVVMEFAQALVVFRGNEQGPVPTEGDNVVHHHSPGTPSLRRAHPAPWLSRQLSGPQVICPNGLAVPTVICCACLFPALPCGRHMFFTPAVPGELRTARVAAGAQGSPCHGLSPPCLQKQKRRNQQSTPLGVYWLRRSTLWPLAISTCMAVLQSRQ